ncbi:hypothetical protein CUC08_Gglean011293 [Alternaria sp. MG1]|jgi:hypothetical protein|uniref:Uncharacterized protein n=2 Tax=Alternaria alternata complex TaxID=187734 RepID=A0A4Q4NJR2_ALTAL|nr:hypothetical protein AALT_g4459 [Alternaria alternata]RII24288.1 hypothetical protein CUC08_Gglean011293 [Alternaria sp. MG1]RYN20759.1 hypothetical protein AA0115_g10024 [Alternaria tenuissima]RYN48375.1 hypothetical protein AA0114_g7187 [Alternaria tenuissima]RYN63344.1 hypothetical protein AA0118_g4927 [Alternaria tenuissima]
MIFLDSTSFTEEDATFLRNLGEFRHFVYLEAKQCFVFPSKIRGIGQNRKDHKALLEHFLKSLKTLKLHGFTCTMALMVLKLAAKGQCWPKMGTLQLTYLPRKRKLYRLRSEMSELVKSSED